LCHFSIPNHVGYHCRSRSRRSRSRITLRLRIRLRPKDAAPCGSGSTTLVRSSLSFFVNHMKKELHKMSRFRKVQSTLVRYLLKYQSNSFSEKLITKINFWVYEEFLAENNTSFKVQICRNVTSDQKKYFFRWALILFAPIVLVKFFGLQSLHWRLLRNATISKIKSDICKP
jgi:hypothetical protein